ncbi:hypothetical protein ACFSLT_31135 [Novosphingobium resinovorum]
MRDKGEILVGADTDILFTPFDAGGLTLRNRFVMAPMTRNFSPGGIPSPGVADYYRRRAAADVGLIVTEGSGSIIPRRWAANRWAAAPRPCCTARRHWHAGARSSLRCTRRG